jgi:hypothetical protein
VISCFTLVRLGDLPSSRQSIPCSILKKNFNRKTLLRIPFMLRKNFLAAVALVACDAAAHAEIMLMQSAPTPLAGTEGLVSYNLIATSNAGETINGVSAPDVTLGDGMGLHQVWTPIIGSPTPTRQEQLAVGVLWNDTWRPYDSHWFFDAANSLSIGAAFTETNTGNGEALPTGGYGAPDTGYGVMGTTGGTTGAKALPLATGLPGNNVTFGQFVMKATDNVLVDVTVLTSDYISRTFIDFCLGANCEGAPLTTLDSVPDDAVLPGVNVDSPTGTDAGILPEPPTVADSSADADGNGDGSSDAAEDVIWPNLTPGSADSLNIIPFVPPPKPPYVASPRPVLSPAAAPEPSSLVLLAGGSLFICRVGRVRRVSE